MTTPLRTALLMCYTVTTAAASFAQPVRPRLTAPEGLAGINCVVTTTASSGMGSVSDCLSQTNANPGMDSISFNIPGSGPHTIVSGSTLSITDPVLIDGYTQPGARPNTMDIGSDANLLIELVKDPAASSLTKGLSIGAGGSGSFVAGLVIRGFFSQIEVLGANNVALIGNYLGTDATGMMSLGGVIGVSVANGANVVSIGNFSPDSRNVSGTTGSAVTVSGATTMDNVIVNNYLGVNAQGTAAFSGMTRGIVTDDCGSLSIVRNIVSGNFDCGVCLRGATQNVLVDGNCFGTDATCTNAIPNGDNIRGSEGSFGSPSNITIGTSEGGNQIAFAVDCGVEIDGGGWVLIKNNIRNNTKDGLCAQGSASPVVNGGTISGNGRAGVYVTDDATCQMNEVTCTGNGGDCLTVTGNGSAEMNACSTFDNGHLGSDLGDDGVTANSPADAHTDFPNITTAETMSDGTTRIAGTVSGDPNVPVRVQLFQNDECDPSGHGEGKRFLCETTTTTGTFDLNCPSATGFITGTCTIGDKTSEFAACTRIGTTPAATVDLALTKTNGTSQSTAGLSTTYTLTVQNMGTGTASGAHVLDTMPPELQGVSWDCFAEMGSSCGTASGSANIDTMVDVGASSSVTFNITGTVDPFATGSLSNTATVTHPLDPTGASATDTDSIVRTADVSVTKVGGEVPLRTSGAMFLDVLWLITVTNHGPSSASVTITDDLPNIREMRWDCGGNAPCSPAGGTADIFTTVSLGPSQAVEIYVAGKPAQAGEFPNTVNIFAVPDHNPLNDTSSDRLIVFAPSSDLQTSITNGVTSVSPGDDVTYTSVIENPSTFTIEAAKLSATFSPHLEGAISTFTPGPGSTSPASLAGNFDTTVTLGPNSSISISTQGKVGASASGNLISTISVTPPETVSDNNSANNSATDSDPVVPRVVDLSVTKTASHTEASAGQKFSYTVTVRYARFSNFAAMSGVKLFDDLSQFVGPLGSTASWVCEAIDGASVSPREGVGNLDVSVDIPEFAVHHEVRCFITVTVPPDSAGPLKNTAKITLPPGFVDGNFLDNSSTVLTEIKPSSISLRPIGVEGQEVSVLEGSDPNRPSIVSLEIALSRPRDVPTTVRFGPREGSDSPAMDFSKFEGSVLLAPGETTTQVQLEVIPDDVDEVDELFVFEVMSTDVAADPEKNHVFVTVIDDDVSAPPTVEVTADPMNVQPGGTAEFTISTKFGPDPIAGPFTTRLSLSGKAYIQKVQVSDPAARCVTNVYELQPTIIDCTLPSITLDSTVMTIASVKVSETASPGSTVTLTAAGHTALHSVSNTTSVSIVAGKPFSRLKIEQTLERLFISQGDLVVIRPKLKVTNEGDAPSTGPIEIELTFDFPPGSFPDPFISGSGWSEIEKDGKKTYTFRTDRKLEKGESFEPPPLPFEVKGEVRGDYRFHATVFDGGSFESRDTDEFSLDPRLPNPAEISVPTIVTGRQRN